MKLPAARPFAISLRAAAACATALALAGCGGGGGDAGLSLSNAFAVGQAYQGMLSANRSWSTTGVGSDGRTYTFTVATQRLADATFALTGTSAARVRQTVTLSASGNSPITSPSITDTYFNASTGLPIGTFSPDDNSCSRITAATALPSQATPGATGAFTTETELSSCAAGAVSQGTTTTTWSLVAVVGRHRRRLRAAVPEREHRRQLRRRLRYRGDLHRNQCRGQPRHAGKAVRSASRACRSR